MQRLIDPIHAELIFAALEAAGEGIVVCDDKGQEIYRNASASAFCSDPGGDVLAEQAIAQELASALEGRPGERTLRLFAPLRRDLSIRSRPLSENGRLLGAAAIVDDISERRRLESMRRDFIANVSHELKTPVGALSLLAETLDGEDDPEVVARLSGRIAAEAARLARLIDDLLDLSRIEVNENPPDEAVSIAEVLEQAVEPLRAVAASRDISLVLPSDRNELSVSGNRRDLVSAVANLVDNAIKYSELGSTVTLSATKRGRFAQIRVADHGIGIPAGDRERIFERFYRVDRARSRSTGGTGLGLSIVRHVAVNHGGHIKVESIEGEGSTFVLSIPLRRSTGEDGSG